jgi:hypothetical protein
MLATLRDDRGNTTVHGLSSTEVWTGEPYSPEQFRSDAGVLAGVSLLGDGAVSDMLWTRPAITIVGIDCPPVVGSATAVVPRASARLNLRIPPGVAPEDATAALVHHLHEVAPWQVQVTVNVETSGEAFRSGTDGPAYRAMAAAMQTVYGRPAVELGQGGSIPLCSVFAATYPRAEIMLIGVEEPLTSIHAPNESVSPQEIADMALVEALFLQGGPTRKASELRCRVPTIRHDPSVNILELLQQAGCCGASGSAWHSYRGRTRSPCAGSSACSASACSSRRHRPVPRLTRTGRSSLHAARVRSITSAMTIATSRPMTRTDHIG